MQNAQSVTVLKENKKTPYAKLTRPNSLALPVQLFSLQNSLCQVSSASQSPREVLQKLTGAPPSSRRGPASARPRIVAWPLPRIRCHFWPPLPSSTASDLHCLPHIARHPSCRRLTCPALHSTGASTWVVNVGTLWWAAASRQQTCSPVAH